MMSASAAAVATAAFTVASAVLFNEIVEDVMTTSTVTKYVRDLRICATAIINSLITRGTRFDPLLHSDVFAKYKGAQDCDQLRDPDFFTEPLSNDNFLYIFSRLQERLEKSDSESTTASTTTDCTMHEFTGAGAELNAIKLLLKLSNSDIDDMINIADTVDFTTDFRVLRDGKIFGVVAKFEAIDWPRVWVKSFLSHYVMFRRDLLRKRFAEERQRRNELDTTAAIAISKL